MSSPLYSFLVAGFGLACLVTAQTAASGLTGTWTTKSKSVLTGSGFYDPVNEKFIEPTLTGISYSFTDDGWYEEAYYRAVSNPTTPACPQGIIQWQHGTYTINPNGSLSLSPIAVDGRQLQSNPCEYKTSIYTRYNQSEYFERYSVYIDPYHNVLRLDLYEFDGTPMNPMYIAYNPPEMLPTQTLNPTTASSTGAAATATSNSKRSVEEVQPLNYRVIQKRAEPINADRWWWIGVGMTLVGSVGYFCF